MRPFGKNSVKTVGIQVEKKTKTTKSLKIDKCIDKPLIQLIFDRSISFWK